MAHVGRAVDHQTLDLMEHRGMSHVVIDAIGAAGNDYPIGRRAGLHGAHLNRRGVGAQHLPLPVRVRWQIERVVHLPRRMIRRNVERGEVVEVVLDVRAFGNCEAHLGKDGDQLLDHLRDRVDTAFCFGSHRQRDIDALAREAGFELGRR